MARQYAAEKDGWALAKRGKKAVAVKVRETGDGVPLGSQRDLVVPYEPRMAAKAAFVAWVDRVGAASRGVNPLVKDILAVNLERLDREGHTVRTTATRYKRLVTMFGSVGVKDVSQKLCQDYAVQMERDGYSANTIWGDLNSLRSALKSAYQTKQIDAPCHEFVWNVAKPEGRTRVLTPDEFWAWYDGATSAHLRLFLVVALLTAQRHEAILELKWDHVDFDAGLIDFAAGMRDRRTVADKGYQKNRAVVSMTGTLRAYLLAAKAVAKTAFVIEYQGRRVLNCGEGCRAAREAAGLENDVTPHVLRHTAITWAEAGGVNIETLAQMSGHKDKRVLESVYLHRDGHGSKPAVDAVEAKLGVRFRVVK